MTNFEVVPVENLANALAIRSQSLHVGGGDFPFLKLNQDGSWTFGADKIETQEQSRWAVNPNSFTEGFIAWGKSEVIDERMVSMTSAAPILQADLPPVPEATKGWQKQLGCMLVCTNGDDKGTQVLFKTSSFGGVKGVRALVDAVVTQLGTDQVNIMPIVELSSENYKHKDWGKIIYSPVFDVKSWVPVDTTDVEPEPEVKTKAVKKRRRPAATA